MTTALIFAGTSFLGQFVRSALEGQGVRVVVTSRRPSTDPAIIQGDLTDCAFAGAAIEAVRPDWIVNCAGAAASGDPMTQIRVHVTGTMSMLEDVQRIVPRCEVVLIGSAAEYGLIKLEDMPIREDVRPAPHGAFGASKLAQTAAAEALASKWNLSILLVRPFNILGPGLPDHYFAAALARQLAEKSRAEKPGEFSVLNAEATRDFVDVRDVASAIAGLLGQRIATPGMMRIFNIATGVETSLLEVASRLGQLAGGFTPIAGGRGESRSFIDRSRGDASRLRQAIGWRPRIRWERSVADLWAETTRDR